MKTAIVLISSLAVAWGFTTRPAMTHNRAAARVPSRSGVAMNAFSFEFPNIFGPPKTGNKKLCVITGASSGLGLETARVLAERGDYYIIAAVRDTEKMKAEAERVGIATDKYTSLECDLADLASVRKFSKSLKAFKGPRPLDALVCNAAVYRPTDPKPMWSVDGFEMSMASNHLGHFLLTNLVLEDMAKNKAKDARVVIVGSITGNSNTVGGGLVYPRADVGKFQGWQGDGKFVDMIDGKPFLGAKAYKDSKVCNMMTVNELHRRYHADTGITFSSMYPGCIADTPLFREKRDWFRQIFPLFMKYVTGGYVSMPEAGERLAQVVHDPICRPSGKYWSWNGGAKTVAYVNPLTNQLTGAGGSGGEIFENDQSGMTADPVLAKEMFELSSKLVGCSWPESYKRK